MICRPGILTYTFFMIDTSLSACVFRHNNPHHLDFIDYDPSHPMRTIFFDHLDFLEYLDQTGKARPCVLDNVQRSLLCRTVYLGYDYFECQDAKHCNNFSVVPRSCHSRFCTSCGVKYAKQLAARVSSFCLDVPHRHVVFTIPEELRIFFRQDRSRLQLLFTAARNTICALANRKLLKKMKKKHLKGSYYLFKDYRYSMDFGMVATLHTFGRDLKWNPHIHALVPERIYDPVKDKIKNFHHLDFTMLRKTFQYEILRLLQESVGPSFSSVRSRSYKDHPDGFYVYAHYAKKEDDLDSKDFSDDINGCISYAMRYAGRPCIAESRIVSYDREKDQVHWYYHDHADDKRHDVVESAIEFIKKVIIHIPDHHFRNIHYFGFYSNASQKRLDHLHELIGKARRKDYSRKKRKAKLRHSMARLKYRVHMIDSFNRDPIKCKCGWYMEYKSTYNPLEGIHNDREYRKSCLDEMHRLRVYRSCTRMGPGRTGFG